MQEPTITEQEAVDRCKVWAMAVLEHEILEELFDIAGSPELDAPFGLIKDASDCDSALE